VCTCMYVSMYVSVCMHNMLCKFICIHTSKDGPREPEQSSHAE